MIARFLAIFWARNKEFLRDKSALAWNFLFPVIVIFGFGFAFSGKGQELFKVTVLTPDLALATSQVPFLQTPAIAFVPAPVSDRESALARLRRHQMDMVIEVPGPSANGAEAARNEAGSTRRYWINETAPKGLITERLLLGSTQPTSAPNGAFQRESVTGQEIRYVDWLISGLLAMNIMFGALFGVGYVLVRYRKNGVLKRLKATPLRAIEFLLAQIASRMILLVASSVIIYGGSHAVLRFRMMGSYWDLMVVLVLGSICLVSLGLLFASRISSEEFAGGLLNAVTWPMMFLSGVWFSLEGANPWVRTFAKVFPLTHVIDAARAVMTEGAGLTAIAPQLIALSAMSLIFLTLGSLLFKWE